MRMSLFSSLRRTLAVATVVAGVALLTLAVQGVTRVDARLELAAAKQAAPTVVDCPFRERHHKPHADRQPV
jgi:hypothetical protein